MPLSALGETPAGPTAMDRIKAVTAPDAVPANNFDFAKTQPPLGESPASILQTPEDNKTKEISGGTLAVEHLKIAQAANGYGAGTRLPSDGPTQRLDQGALLRAHNELRAQEMIDGAVTTQEPKGEFELTSTPPDLRITTTDQDVIRNQFNEQMQQNAAVNAQAEFPITTRPDLSTETQPYTNQDVSQLTAEELRQYNARTNFGITSQTPDLTPVTDPTIGSPLLPRTDGAYAPNSPATDFGLNSVAGDNNVSSLLMTPREQLAPLDDIHGVDPTPNRSRAINQEELLAAHAERSRENGILRQNAEWIQRLAEDDRRLNSPEFNQPQVFFQYPNIGYTNTAFQEMARQMPGQDGQTASALNGLQRGLAAFGRFFSGLNDARKDFKDQGIIAAWGLFKSGLDMLSADVCAVQAVRQRYIDERQQRRNPQARPQPVGVFPHPQGPDQRVEFAPPQPVAVAVETAPAQPAAAAETPAPAAEVAPEPTRMEQMQTLAQELIDDPAKAEALRAKMDRAQAFCDKHDIPEALRQKTIISMLGEDGEIALQLLANDGENLSFIEELNELGDDVDPGVRQSLIEDKLNRPIVTKKEKIKKPKAATRVVSDDRSELLDADDDEEESLEVEGELDEDDEEEAESREADDLKFEDGDSAAEAKRREQIAQMVEVINNTKGGARSALGLELQREVLANRVKELERRLKGKPDVYTDEISSRRATTRKGEVINEVTTCKTDGEVEGRAGVEQSLADTRVKMEVIDAISTGSLDGARQHLEREFNDTIGIDINDTDDSGAKVENFDPAQHKLDIEYANGAIKINFVKIKESDIEGSYDSEFTTYEKETGA